MEVSFEKNRGSGRGRAGEELDVRGSRSSRTVDDVRGRGRVSLASWARRTGLRGMFAKPRPDRLKPFLDHHIDIG